MKVLPVPTSSEKEWPGLERAIEEIGVVKNRLHKEGLSQVAFFIGVCNLPITCYVLGRFPEHIWLLYVAKSSLYIPAWFYEVTRRYNGSLFVLDYCWVMNIVLAVYMGILFFVGPSLSDEARRYGFLAFYATALGPLSWACLVLHNGLIFHSVEKTASLFIHFTPSMVAWTLRWYPEVVSAAWPDRFPVHTLAVGETGQLYIAGIIPYLIWLALHGLWLITIGVDCPDRGCETVFNDLYKKKDLATSFTKLFGCTGIRSHASIYLALHGVACSIAFLWSLLCYRFYWVHTIFSVSVFISAAWFGSGYYTYLFTGIYTRALSKLMPADQMTQSCSLAVKEHMQNGV